MKSSQSSAIRVSGGHTVHTVVTCKGKNRVVRTRPSCKLLRSASHGHCDAFTPSPAAARIRKASVSYIADGVPTATRRRGKQPLTRHVTTKGCSLLARFTKTKDPPRDGLIESAVTVADGAAFSQQNSSSSSSSKGGGDHVRGLACKGLALQFKTRSPWALARSNSSTTANGRASRANRTSEKASSAKLLTRYQVPLSP